MEQYNIGQTYNLEVKGTIAGVTTSIFINLVCRRVYQTLTQPDSRTSVRWCTFYDFYHINESISNNITYKDKKPVTTRIYYE